MLGPSSCQDFLRRLDWETKTGAAIGVFRKHSIGEFPYVSEGWLIRSRIHWGQGRPHQSVISGAVGSSLMRFHATIETGEGQYYDALQQGVPQQPVVPLLLHLPPHKTSSCKAMCEAGVLSVARPGTACWHRHSADVRRRVTKFSLSPGIRCYMCVTAEVRLKACLSFSVCVLRRWVSAIQ